MLEFYERKTLLWLRKKASQPAEAGQPNTPSASHVVRFLPWDPPGAALATVVHSNATVFCTRSHTNPDLKQN